jgi:uncharacterized membrane protein YozB (DUF420 family)
MWRRWLREVPRRVFLLVMLAGWALIAAASLVYFDPETLPPFVIEKLPLRFEALWLASLQLHVASAALSFPLCLALLTRSLQRRPRLHRWLGRFTGTCVLLALVPSGIVLAFDAKGGAVVSAGFMVSGAIVAVSMVYGVLAARRGDLIAHARAMRHVVAQMSVAVSSRALIVALDAAGSDPQLAYVVALWGPVLASAVAAELLSRRSLALNPFHTLHRISHGISSLARLARLRSLTGPVFRLGR